MCKCVLPPGDNPIAVNKYIKLRMGILVSYSVSFLFMFVEFFSVLWVFLTFFPLLQSFLCLLMQQHYVRSFFGLFIFVVVVVSVLVLSLPK